MAALPRVRQDIAGVVESLCQPIMSRQKVLFVSPRDACRTQMSAAFLRSMDQSRYHVITAGTNPSLQILPAAVEIMAEKQLDIKYLQPLALKQQNISFDRVICFGRECENIPVTALKKETWDIPFSEDMPVEKLRQLRDDLETRVKDVFSNQITT